MIVHHCVTECTEKIQIRASVISVIGSATGSEWHDGLINTVRVYNRALSPAEALMTYERPFELFLPPRRVYLVPVTTVAFTTFPRKKKPQRRPALRRKKQQPAFQGLNIPALGTTLLRKSVKKRKVPRRQKPKKAFIIAPTGGCPTLSVQEALSSTARATEAMTGSALLAERRSASALLLEAMTSTALAQEKATASARVVPCVKGYPAATTRRCRTCSTPRSSTTPTAPVWTGRLCRSFTTRPRASTPARGQES